MLINTSNLWQDFDSQGTQISTYEKIGLIFKRMEGHGESLSIYRVYTNMVRKMHAHKTLRWRVG